MLNGYNRIDAPSMNHINQHRRITTVTCDSYLDISEPVVSLEKVISSKNLIITSRYDSWPQLIHDILYPNAQLQELENIYCRWYKLGYMRCLRQLISNNQVVFYVRNGCPPFDVVKVEGAIPPGPVAYQYFVLHMPDQTLFRMEEISSLAIQRRQANVHNLKIELKNFDTIHHPNAMLFESERDHGMERFIQGYHNTYIDVPTFDGDDYGGQGDLRYRCYRLEVLLQMLQQSPQKYKKCRLALEGCNMGYAFPIQYHDRQEMSKIDLIGRINCGRAATGDVVVVKLYERPNPNSEFYGCVIGVLEPALKRVSSLIPCRYTTNAAVPLFPGVPQLFFQRNQSERRNGPQGADADAAETKKRMTIFNPIRVAPGKMVAFDKNPKEVQLNPVDRSDYLVLVHEEGWNPRYDYPLGRIVARLKYPVTVGDTIPYLRLYYQMPLCGDLEMKLTTHLENLKQKFESELKKRVDWSSRGTTFILDDAKENGIASKDCDQALSVFQLTAHTCFEVAFHVCDVADLIPHDSPLDRQSRTALCAYSEHIGGNVYYRYLFPTNLTENVLAFKPNERRLAVSFVFYFSYDGELLPEPPKGLLIPNISPGLLKKGILHTFIQPQRQMSASRMAQCLAQDGTGDAELANTLAILCRMTRHLRQCRLGPGAFSVPVEEGSGFMSPPMDVEFRFMMEEFTHLANDRMLKLVRNSPLGKSVPVKVSPQPPRQDVEGFVEKFASYIRNSPLLQQQLVAMSVISRKTLNSMLETEREKQNSQIQHTSPTNSLAISSQLLVRIKHILLIDPSKISEVARLLAIESLLPGVQLVSHHLQRLTSRQEWTLLGEDEASPKAGLSPPVHLDACHPLKNYMHIFVQRCVKLVLASEQSRKVEVPIERRNLLPLLRDLSHVESRFFAYRQAKERIMLAKECFHQPVVVQATVVDCNHQEIVLNHPFLGCVTTEEQFSGNEGQHISANDMQVHNSEPLISEVRMRSANPDEDNNNNLRMFEFSWVARIYSLSGRHTDRRDDRDLTLNLNRIMRNVQEPFSTQGAFKLGQHLFTLSPESVQQERSGMVKDFFDSLQSVLPFEDPSIVDDVLSEYDLDGDAFLEQMTRCAVVRFSMRIGPGHTLALQYGSSQFSVHQPEFLSVRPHYLHLTSSFGMCLEHRRFPEKCFLTKRLKRIPPTFSDIREYVQSHLLVNRYENLYQAVKDIVTVRLVDVPVHWFRPNVSGGSQENTDPNFAPSQSSLGAKEAPLIGVFFMKQSFVNERFLPLFCPERGRICSMKKLLENAGSSVETLFFFCLTSNGIREGVMTDEEQTFQPKWIAHGYVNTISLVEPKNFSQQLLQSGIISEDEKQALDESEAYDEYIMACTIVITSSLSDATLDHLTTRCNFELIKNPTGAWQMESCFNTLLRFPEPHWLHDLALGILSTNDHRNVALSEDQMLNPPIRLMQNPQFEDDESTERVCAKMQGYLEKIGLSLNSKQMIGVTNGLRNRVSLIFGPPGTGKSTVIACLALAFFLRNRSHPVEEARANDDEDEENEGGPKKRTLLVIAPSNTAADVVAESILTLFKKVFGPEARSTVPYTILRLYGKSLEMEDYPVPGLHWNYYNSMQRNLLVPESLKEIAVHHAAHKMNPSLTQNLRNVRLPKDAYDYRKLAQDTHQRLVATADILCCTTVSSAQKWISNRNNFVQVVFDEAGMCKEGETFLPFKSGVAPENLVLVGDDKQLAPILMSPDAGQLGLGVSLFERYSKLWKKNDHLVAALNVQYRMHPSICEFPSKHIYDDGLLTAPSKKWTGLEKHHIQEPLVHFWTGINSRYVVKSNVGLPQELIPEEAWPGVRSPEQKYNLRLFTSQPFPTAIPQHPPEGVRERVVFIHVEKGSEVTSTHASLDIGSNSKANFMEADEVIRIFTRMVNRAKQLKTSPNVIILSQYRYQVKVLNDKIHRLYGDSLTKDGARAITVNSSQGSEWDYVIFSTVRSQPQYNLRENPSIGWQRKHMGFIIDKNQVNVAITRARKGLIIIGNANLLQLNETWRALIGDLKERRCYIDGTGVFYNL